MQCFGYRNYNSSTGGWINRDPQEEAGGANLYRFVENGPIGSVDPFGLTTLSYNTDVLGSKDLGCGLFINLIKWKLDPVAINGGYISQRVKFHVHVEHCPVGPVYDKTGAFTEVWRVSPMKSIFGLFLWNNIEFGGLDMFGNNVGGNCTKGYVKVVASAVFNNGLTSLPPGFAPGGFPQSGKLWSIPGYATLGGGKSNYVTRGLTYTWDCCNGNREKSLVRSPEDEWDWPMEHAAQPNDFRAAPPNGGSGPRRLEPNETVITEPVF